MEGGGVRGRGERRKKRGEGKRGDTISGHEEDASISWGNTIEGVEEAWKSELSSSLLLPLVEKPIYIFQDNEGFPGQLLEERKEFWIIQAFICKKKKEVNLTPNFRILFIFVLY